MAERVGVPQVGAPDPEKRNSQVIEETAEDFVKTYWVDTLT